MMVVAVVVMLFVVVMLVGLMNQGRARPRPRPTRGPEVVLPGVPCRAMLVTLGPKRFTSLDVNVPSDVGVIRLSTPAHQLSEFWGGRDLTLGDGPFDRRYCVQANPAELAWEILDRETRSRILRIDGVSEEFVLELRPGLLRVRMTRALEGGARDEFLAEVAPLVARILERGTKGVRVEAVREREGRCLVCGCAVEASRRVRCSSCQAPHHPDCWAYNGGCSTFGCRGGRA